MRRCCAAHAEKTWENAMTYVTEENLTDLAVERWSNIPDPRLREVMAAAVKHLHAFVREVEPTQQEWFTAIQWLTRIGQICDQKRQEFILLSDVMGISMLVDAINNRTPGKATPSTVEGPFHIPNSPEIADGGNMAEGAPGIPCFITGRVVDLDGNPIAGAMLDMWQTDGEGLYEAQIQGAEDYMRGIYHTNADGTYSVRTVAPIGYTIPMDGPIGDLMRQTKISHMRPAHIHFHIAAPGYKSLTTHIFQKGCQYIDTDVVFGVKEPLIVEFVKRPPGKAPNGETVNTEFYEVKYDFVLAKAAAAQKAA
jgi:hydroxyquinol 1,2-dioxygenase